MRATTRQPAKIEIVLPRPHPGQRALIDGARRFNVWSCGRRFGKTNLLEAIDIKPALAGYPVGWFSPSYKYMLEVWRDVYRMLAPVVKRISTQDHRLELVTGGVVEFWSLDNPDAGRSRRYKRVAIDEAGLVKIKHGAELGRAEPASAHAGADRTASELVRKLNASGVSFALHRRRKTCRF